MRAPVKFALKAPLVLRAFDDRTAARGKVYWRRGLVKDIRVVDGRLTGRVQGTAFRPYTVRISVVRGRVESECTCPVGWQCKHGAALCFRWLEDPAEEVVEVRSDDMTDPETAIHVLRALLDKHPELEAEAEAICRGPAVAVRKAYSVKARFREVVGQDPEHRSIRDVNTELTELVWNWEKASEDMDARIRTDVSMSMFESLAEAIALGDDPDGMLFHLAGRCVDLFSEAVAGLDDHGKDSLRPRAMKLFLEDLNELGADDLLLHTVTEGNAAEVIAEIEAHRGPRSEGRSPWHESIYDQMASDLEDAIVRKSGRAARRPREGPRKGRARGRKGALR